MARTSARLRFAKPPTLVALSATMLCVSPLPRAAVPHAAVPRHTAEVHCLADGSGYLRARLRGALAADLDWRKGSLECEGGMRPDGRGIRVSFAGPLRLGGVAHRLRFIFGIEAPGAGRSGRALPTNVTLIFEGERRIFSTRGDGQCTVDDLHQQPLASTAREQHYRVAARGFCVGPATSLTGSGRVLVSRFDFSGRIALDRDPGAAKPHEDAKPTGETTAARGATPARRPVS